MAKLPRGTKTKAIDQYLSGHSEATVTEVVAALKATGLPVSKQMVSNRRIKIGAAPKKRGRKKKGKGAAAKQDGTMLSLKLLMQAKKLSDQLGGIEQAKAAMDALAKLQ